MGGTLASVVLAAVAFVGGHFVLSSGPIRNVLVRRIGERPFRGAYSLVAAATLAWLIYAYNRAPRVDIWAEPSWSRVVALVLVFCACMFFVGSFAAANPALAGNEVRAARSEPGRGIFAVTRHPMLWAFALWGIAHAIANGDAASLVFFGAFSVLALGGMAHIDARKHAVSDPVWAKVEAVTSALPFRAMVQGRARFRFADLGWWRLLGGIALFAVLLHAHRPVIGLSPFP
jgi:uncharacterized membrane protein